MATSLLDAGTIIYEATLGGEREGNETADLGEVMETIRTHLDAAESSGRALKITITEA